MSHHYHIIHRSLKPNANSISSKNNPLFGWEINSVFYFCIQYNYNLTDAFNKCVQDVNLQRFINHQTFRP